MERGVIVGGILISISFLLAVMLNRSAMETAPVRSVNAEGRDSAADIAPHSPTANPPVASQSPVRAVEATFEPAQDASSKGRRDDCFEKNTAPTATSPQRPDDCSSQR